MAPQQSIKTKRNSSTDKKLVIEKPLRVYHHKRRRYVRLEVNSPIRFRPLDPTAVTLDLREPPPAVGTVLNISGGGVLMETTFPISEGDYVVMEITLKEAEVLSGVVGRVKRVDTDDKSGPPLVGVEFLTPEQLRTEMPPQLEQVLGEKISSFDDRIRRMLLKYVFSHKLSDA